jgi:microcystin synthetase protein McyA
VLQQKLGGQPLFEAAFNFLNYHVLRDVMAHDEMELTSGGFIEETNFPLLAHCGLNPKDSGVYVMLKYDAYELRDPQVKAIGGYYAKVLKAMATSAS